MIRPRRLAKDAFVGLFIFALLLLLCEGALRLAGGGAAADLTRGFDRNAAYFAPSPELTGGWTTQWADRNQPERHIPPKSDRVRVVLFGGSNTYNFPAEHLEEVLGPDRYEVINLGRRGYGSERVSVIFEQALEHLAPDLAVIYCGHNEFVERGFQMDLNEQADDPLWQAARSLGRHSRTIALLTKALRPSRLSAQEKPEAWKSEYGKFRNISYAETLRYYDAYERNLTRMCALAEQRGVAVILSTIIHNRLATPFVSTVADEVESQAVARLKELRSKLPDLMPISLGPLLAPSEKDRVHHMDWERPKKHTETSERRGARPGLRTAGGPFAQRDLELGEHWQEHAKVWRLYEALDALWNEHFTAGERTDMERALELMEEILTIDPSHPRTLFEAGICEIALGRTTARTSERIESAAQFDRAPRRGNAETNRRVQAVAANHDVLFFDADALFASRIPFGLTGWEWMLDHCHLNPGAAEVLMEDFAPVIASNKAEH